MKDKTLYGQSFRDQLAALDKKHDEALSKNGGYRCFDGCPDTALKAKLGSEDLILKEIKKLEPGAHCTYFPVEEKWQVHISGRDIGPFLYSRRDALLGALAQL